MKIHPYVTATGKVTTSTDPNRSVWYSTHCGYWTDNWTKVPARGPGIPTCPHCGVPGFEVSFKQWWSSAEKYQADGHPGYLAELEGRREKCSKPNPKITGAN